jgi:hypothetical protein
MWCVLIIFKDFYLLVGYKVIGVWSRLEGQKGQDGTSQ